jgi:signal transduction histidine kinase/response regulator RpfG family c-di-GMP phosphodiesterase
VKRRPAKARAAARRSGRTTRATGAAPRAKRARQRPTSAPSAASRPTGPERLIAELNADRERLNTLYLLAVEQNRQRADKLHRILENICDINSGLDLDALLRRLADTIASTLGFRVVLIRLREPGTDRLRACAFSGINAASRAALERQDVSLIEFLSWLREEFKVSESYFISHAHDFNRRLPAGVTPDLGSREAGEWHPEDVLIVPLFDRAGEPVAYFSVDDPLDRHVPSRETIELLEIFANHAVVAIENARLYRRLETRSRELEEAGTRMGEVLTLKNNFVSTVSHELRTPLAAISAYVASLLSAQEGQIDHDHLQRFLTVVSEESQRLTRLIESLLDLNRIDAGPAKMTRQTIDMRELVEETTRLLTPVAQIGQVALKDSIDCADTRVDGDRDQLRQLALHLGSNAIKFTPPGGSVTVRLFGDAREIGLQVEDTGIGIPENALDKIFERFYQVDSSLERKFGGTGLGLAICKSIAEWHGGRVFAESEVGRGSRFTVVLPRRSERRVAVRPPTRPRASVEDVLKLAVEIVAETMNAQVVSLMARDADGSWTIRAAMGLDETVVRETRVPAGSGVVGWVGDRRRPVCLPESADELPVRGSGRTQYNTSTFLSVPVENSDELLGVLNVTDPEDGRLFRAEDWHLLVHLARRVSGVWDKARAIERMQMDIDGSTQALRQVLQHLQRSRLSAPDRVPLARSLARELKLSEDEIGLIGFAASLHDLGMNMVGEHVTEGGGRLDDEDRERLARHPEFAADTLELLGRIRAVEEIILSHHECWDGSGYPRGLSGDQIPIGARILALVDAWESMTIGRAHRPARGSDDARLELLRLRGRQFDPDVVDAFDRALADVRRTREFDRRMEPAESRVPATAADKTGR